MREWNIKPANDSLRQDSEKLIFLGKTSSRKNPEEEIPIEENKNKNRKNDNNKKETLRDDMIWYSMI